MWTIITSFFTSFIIVYFTIPSVVNVARIRHLFDIPDVRKIHKSAIPSLGGVAIFAAVFFSIIFWSQAEDFTQLRWIILALVIIFLLGLKDDIVALDPFKKLIGQIVAAMLLVIWGNIRIGNLHGLMGIHELPYIVSIIVSGFSIIAIMNAFNLIDGIDGLAGSIGTISSATFGTVFILNEQLLLALIAFSLTGALLAFLRFNLTPATIFMGDSGSLIVGLILSLLCIKFIDLPVQPNSVVPPSAMPALALAILIIPITDTARVFTIRILNGRSPFRPDRNHIHHQLLSIGFDHKSATLLLSTVNCLFILLTWMLMEVNGNALFVTILLLAFLLVQVLIWAKQRSKAKALTAASTKYAKKNARNLV